MDRKLSEKISAISSIACILVVFIHAEVFQVRLPGGTVDTYGRNLSTIVQLFISEGIAKVGVPLFFFISGFLFYRNFSFKKDDIIRKYKKKFYSYIIPYMIWSVLVFLFYYVLSLIPQTAPFVTSRNFETINIERIIKYVLIQPVNSPLWFLRNLIIFTAIHPIIWGSIKSKRMGGMATVLLFLIWLLNPYSSYISSPGVFYFILGAYTGMHYMKVLQTKKKAIPIALIGAWIVLLVIKCKCTAGLSSDYYLGGVGYSYLNRVFDKVTIGLGVVGTWYLFDLDYMNHITKALLRLKKYTFMIFVMHHPIIMSIKKVGAKLLGFSQMAIVANYMISVSITILIVVAFSTIMERYLPQVYSILNGDRTKKENK